MHSIYLDNNATTRIDPRVAQAIHDCHLAGHVNPASQHRMGRQTRRVLEQARDTVGRILGCHLSDMQADRIVFTSGGTEANNLALLGLAGRPPGRIIISAIEHPSVIEPAEMLLEAGWQLDQLGVDGNGVLQVERLEGLLKSNTALVSVILGNHDAGVIEPLAEVTRICASSGVPVHTDAVQSVGKIPVDVKALGVDLLSLSAHKFYGPKGVGALYVRKGTPLIPHLTGGGQEFGLRAGTQNVPYIVGFAEALRLTYEERGQRVEHVTPLRDRIIGTVLETIPDSCLTGDMESRLPQHASFAFKDVDGNLLLTLLDAAGFACSSGSACKTGNPEPSEVMNAIGLSREWGLGSLRVTLGTGTTAEHVESFLSVLPGLVEKARKLSGS